MYCHCGNSIWKTAKNMHYSFNIYQPKILFPGTKYYYHVDLAIAHVMKNTKIKISSRLIVHIMAISATAIPNVEFSRVFKIIYIKSSNRDKLDWTFPIIKYLQWSWGGQTGRNDSKFETNKVFILIPNEFIHKNMK